MNFFDCNENGKDSIFWIVEVDILIALWRANNCKYKVITS
jgi:hypothetical protein